MIAAAEPEDAQQQCLQGLVPTNGRRILQQPQRRFMGESTHHVEVAGHIHDDLGELKLGFDVCEPHLRLLRPLHGQFKCDRILLGGQVVEVLVGVHGEKISANRSDYRGHKM